MKLPLLIFFCIISQIISSQTLLEHLQKPFKSYTDSICKTIDAETEYSIKKDSVPVYDIRDIGKILFYHTEIHYMHGNDLAKVQIITGSQNSYTYYFSDKILIKAVIFKNQILESEYYYSQDDNKITKPLAERLSMIYPEAKDYYEKLLIGLTFNQGSLKM